jgi:hypothetical protein
MAMHWAASIVWASQITGGLAPPGPGEPNFIDTKAHPRPLRRRPDLLACIHDHTAFALRAAGFAFARGRTEAGTSTANR